MPKLWTDTIEEHRDAVREALLEATGSLVSELGLAGVSMSSIAERAGIGRATLYKYFADLDAVLRAWHERHVAGHLAALAEIRIAHTDPRERLIAMLETYAGIVHASGRERASLMAASLHRGAHAADAERELRRLLRDAIAEAARADVVRRDMPADELAAYALAALGAAAGASRAGVRRLVAATLAGLEGTH